MRGSICIDWNERNVLLCNFNPVEERKTYDFYEFTHESRVREREMCVRCDDEELFSLARSLALCVIVSGNFVALILCTRIEVYDTLSLEF